MTSYHSNVTLTIDNIAGLVWENVDSDTILQTTNLVAGDKVHNMTKNPTISCSVDEVAGAGNEDKVKMTLTVANSDFIRDDLDVANVYNSVNNAGTWELGTPIAVDETKHAESGLVDEANITATSHAMCRTYTHVGASTLNYGHALTVFTADSRGDFETSVITKTLDGLDGILDNGVIVMYAKFETDSTNPHFEYYTDAACTAVFKISTAGTNAQKLLLRMLQLHNDHHSLDLATKLSREMNTQDQPDFTVFNGNSMIVPVDVNVVEGFVNNPGKFGVRITFA